MPMPTAAHELVLTRLIKAWQREGRADASGSALLFNGLGRRQRAARLSGPATAAGRVQRVTAK